MRLHIGVRKIALEENCAPVRVRVGLGLALELGLGAIFFGGNFLRTFISLQKEG